MWRKKYNIPFGSPEHRAASFISMAIDIHEDRMVRGYIEKKNALTEDEGFEDLKGQKKMSKEEIDKSFEDLNIEEFNKKDGQSEQHENIS